MERPNPHRWVKNKYLLPAIAGIIFLVIGLKTLSDYGINWDEPFHFLRGQAYAQFFLTGKKTYDRSTELPPVLIKPGQYISHYDFNAWEGNKFADSLPVSPRPQAEFAGLQAKGGARMSFYENQAWDGRYFIDYDGPGHPPLMDIAAAFSNRFFYQWLGIGEDIESYKIPYIFIGAFGVFLVSLFAFEVTGSYFASFAAGASMALYPMFWSSVHFDIKDTEVAVFYLGAIWAFWHWIGDSKHWYRWLVIFDVFIALSMGVKWNVLFLPFVLAPWLLLIWKSPEFKRWFKPTRIILAGALSLLGVFSFVIAIWPYTWADPIRRLFDVFLFYWKIGTGPDFYKPSGYGSPSGFDFYPLALLITQVPGIILLLSILGFMAIVFRKIGDQRKTGYLIILWLLVPIIRVTAPNLRIYGGMRQAMEVVPAVALLAAIGTDFVLKSLRGWMSKMAPILIVFFFGGLVFSLSRLSPNETMYFNFLVNGPAGAVKAGLVDRMVNYGNVYKQVIPWLNTHAEKEAKIAFLSGPTFALSPLWLRNDIAISPFFFSGFGREGEYIIVSANVIDEPIFARRYSLRFLKPVYVARAEGTALLYVFKNSQENLRPGFDKERTMDNPMAAWIRGDHRDYLSITLNKTVRVTRIRLKNVNPACLAPNYQFIDELVMFKPSRIFEGFDLNVFGLNERTNLGNGEAEFSFPAEPASVIRVDPLSSFSCFLGARVTAVDYLQD